jgi:predicted N-formylglutamate amidohydrolase
MPDRVKILDAEAAALHNPDGRGPVLIVCEHAACDMPAGYGALGLPEALRKSHIAWDPGAFDVSCHLSRHLDAPLVAGAASRLLFDCNRPPDAADAIPQRSELFDIPGNRDLSEADRAERVRRFHDPFQQVLTEALARFEAPPVLVTIHSFTPIYLGARRAVEIGVLHDRDDRLARAMLANAVRHNGLNIKENDPYGPADGVTHTLKKYALAAGLLNVMLEIRNDLVATAAQQQAIAAMLAAWIAAAAADCGAQLQPGAAT